LSFTIRIILLLILFNPLDNFAQGKFTLEGSYLYSESTFNKDNLDIKGIGFELATKYRVLSNEFHSFQFGFGLHPIRLLNSTTSLIDNAATIRNLNILFNSAVGFNLEVKQNFSIILKLFVAAYIFDPYNTSIMVSSYTREVAVGMASLLAKRRRYDHYPPCYAQYLIILFF